MELVLGEYIFEPQSESVHGDFTKTQSSSNELLPFTMKPSRKGPYGRRHADDENDARPFQRLDEKEFLLGIHGGLYSI